MLEALEAFIGLPCRLEQQELHETQSAVAKMWTLLAASEQPVSAAFASTMSLPAEQQPVSQQAPPGHTHSFLERPEVASPHTTSM